MGVRGRTGEAGVAFRETSTAVEKLDVFLNSWTFRSTEYVVDARRALADVLPTSARRPSMTGDHFRRRAATKTQHDSRSRVLDTDLSQTVPSSSGSPRMTNSKVPKVPTFGTDAMSPPVQTTTRSEFLHDIVSVHIGRTVPQRLYSVYYSVLASHPRAPVTAGGFGRIGETRGRFRRGDRSSREKNYL